MLCLSTGSKWEDSFVFFQSKLIYYNIRSCNSSHSYNILIVVLLLTRMLVLSHFLFRRTNGAARCRLTAAFLPAIFHHMIHSLSVVVDLFLGITPSLSGCLSTFVGVPQGLYGPLTDVPEYFQYASVRSPDSIFIGRQSCQPDTFEIFLSLPFN